MFGTPSKPTRKKQSNCTKCGRLRKNQQNKPKTEIVRSAKISQVDNATLIKIILLLAFATRSFCRTHGEQEFLKHHGQVILMRLSWVLEIDEQRSLKREPLNELL